MPFFEMINSIDFGILDFIQNNFKSEFLDYIMAFLSYIGEAGIIWIVSSIVMLFFKKTRAMGAMSLCAMAIGYLIGEVGLKNIICRPRPFMQNPDVVLNISPPSGYSFPSGHSCSSFAAATVMLVRDKRFGIPALILVFLIAFSRLYNYVHFPSDVVCGIILGIICAVVVLVVFKKTKLDNRLSGGPKAER